MKLLSCIGCRCEESTFRLLFDDDEDRLEESKETSFEENLMLAAVGTSITEGLVNKEGSAYRFSHDEIQSATYSLIPKKEKAAMHLLIGNLILKNVPREEEENVLFIAVDQLNQGQEFMDEKTKEYTAELNLRAGYKSMSFASFLSAASYLKAGISQLGDGCWDKNYLLTLKLLTSYSEAQCCNGCFSEVSRVADLVIRNSRSFWDKIQAYSTLIQSLSSQNKIQDAMNVAFDVLGELGEHIPASLPDQCITKMNMMKSIQQLAMMSDSKFLGLKEMDDGSIIASMKFLHFLMMFCHVTKQEYLLFVTNRMLELTLSNGVCKESCSAIAICSFILSDSDGDWNVSSKLGNMAFLLLEKLQAQTFVSRIYLLVFSAKGWTTPLKLTTIPHYEAYRKGMSTGDIRNAMSNAFTYCAKQFLCGTKLPVVEKETRVFYDLMVEHKQEAAVHALLPFRQAVLNLMGRSENPLELTGEAMVQEGYLEESFKNDEKYCRSNTYILCSWLAYIFGDYELAALELSRREETEKNMTKKVEYYGMTIFFDCLIYLALARDTGEESLIADVDQKMLKIRKLGEKSPFNNRHRMLLLEAEIACSRGVADKAIEMYDMAITQAGINGYIMEEAISNERAGDFLSALGNLKASHYYGQAINLYRQWGAEEKADELCKDIPF